MAFVQNALVQSTAGAIPVKNEKGQITMEKVKVSRYIAGKRPAYASCQTDDEDDEELIVKKPYNEIHTYNDDTIQEEPIDDPRMKRLMGIKRRRYSDDDDDDETNAGKRKRHSDDSDDEENIEPQVKNEISDDEGDLSDSEIQRRRELIKKRGLNEKLEEQLLDIDEEEAKEEEKQEESEYEEYTDSEEEVEETVKYKPVFVRKQDRLTVQSREINDNEENDEHEQKIAQERRRDTLKMVEKEIERSTKAKEAKKDEDGLDTGDENDEEEFEAWKVRELNRFKRDKEARGQLNKERDEVERIHNMTEEDRQKEQIVNKRIITNKAEKGEVKFMQKYYHRGAFYLDVEESVYKRNYHQPTLEDHFDKTVLPKVMQVKNFGRAGRSKYTHLVDQDTTQMDSPWMLGQATKANTRTNTRR